VSCSAIKWLQQFTEIAKFNRKIHPSMEQSSSQSFSSLMNSSFPPSDAHFTNSLQNPQNPISQQHPNFHPSQNSMNHPPNYPPPPQYNPSFQRQYPQQINLFGAQGGYQQGQGSYQQFSPSSYHGVAYQGSFGQYPPGAFGAGSSGSPASPVGSMPFFGAPAGACSRADDINNSPIGRSASPMSAYPPDEEPADNEESSESSPDESGPKGKSKNWTKHEDELLICIYDNKY
jgi:hypothetical protein